MTFDPYANQGDTAAWDPESAAATKRAADKIFTEEFGDTDSPASDETAEADNPGGEGEGTAVKQDPHPPTEVPDPDIAND